MLFLLLKLSNLLVSAINGKISVILCFDLLDLLNVVMLCSVLGIRGEI